MALIPALLIAVSVGGVRKDIGGLADFDIGVVQMVFVNSNFYSTNVLLHGIPCVLLNNFKYID